MDTFRHRRSPPAERFLGLFSSPPGSLVAAAEDDDGPGVELREDEVLWTGADLSAQATSPRAGAASSSSPSSSRSFRSLSSESLGILAALPEEPAGNRKPGFLYGNPSMPPASSTFASPSLSSSSARKIPAIPKLKHADYSIQHQSAPVNVPVVPGRRRGGPHVEELDGEEYDEEEMLPPHDIMARKGTPMATSSVLEGVGRTLKGRDLRRVRNAVLRQTGFLDKN